MATNGGPATWDPELMGAVVPTPKAHARIMRDITDILQSPIEGIWLAFFFSLIPRHADFFPRIFAQRFVE
jgi:hypothetical protein